MMNPRTSSCFQLLQIEDAKFLLSGQNNRRRHSARLDFEEFVDVDFLVGCAHRRF